MPKWTDDQTKAIFEPSGKGSILVSAAAGSGKTAVLVERIAEMVLRDENPVSIDRLLVVTFTEAAAAEMKERIIARINAAQREAIAAGDTDKARSLREQIHLTTTADINTIDAFCLGVVKNNFHILGIDPNFSIMDNGETDILTEDTIDELFNGLYSSENKEDRERFENLTRIYSSNRDDEGLANMVRKIYNFTQSFAEPVKWLREKADMYSADMADSEWVKRYILRDQRDYIVANTKTAFAGLQREMNVNTPNDTTPEAYWGSLWEKVANCVSAASRLSDAREWDDYISFYSDCIAQESYLGSGRNKHTKTTGADKEIWTLYFKRCDALRKFFKEECKKLPRTTKEAFNEYVHAEEVKRLTDDLVWLVELFSELYEAKKAKRNIKSFSDVEHLAYSLFADNENIRDEYKDKYEEILIDEFQDTNGLQDGIFRLISRDGSNMFMVGDLKQSIYRFRGGDPMIFKSKSRDYSVGDGGKLIMLSQNFRSRMQVIDSINAVFSKMMTDEVGDVRYTGGEALCRDADREVYRDGDNLRRSINTENSYRAELYRIASIKDEVHEKGLGAGKARAEAIMTARRIKELINGKYQIHTGEGRHRNIEYKDIVILMKSVKADGAVFKEELEKRGIGAFVQKEEYFERREIKLMLSLLTLINNHLQDIPLTAVMRSPIGGFTDTELAMIRLQSAIRPFYAAVKGYTAPENATEAEKRLEKRCRTFTAELERWRGYVKSKSIAALIWTLYEETNIYDLMGAIDGGEEAQANLKLLYERAKRYEASGFRGIFNFIRYIGRMEKRREDIAGAQLVTANYNVVRIMTIHKSKGLEFPVVFLAGTAKEIMYHYPGEETRVALHNELGIGLDYYNYEEMYRKPLIFREHINKLNRREHLSEEMRLMYVAATRAREKLIVTASYDFDTRDKYDDALAAWNALKEEMPWDIERRAKCLADWIIPVAQSDLKNWSCEDVCCGREYYGDDAGTEQEKNPESEELSAGIVREILEYSYKYPESGRIPAKTSVTAIKEMADEENIREDDPVYMVSKPAFMRGERLGARIGTAHHQVMAYINLDKMRTLTPDAYEDFIAAETARVADEGQIEKEIADDGDIIDTICKNICGFFRSDMGQAVLRSRKVYREKPFEIEISAREYDGSLDETYEDENVVVQGIIDLFFEDENGDIILVDYKTDRCVTEEEQQAVAGRYRKQLELYERAMEKILKRNVKNKYLYLFSVQNVVEL